jgi:hypothetical protein
MQTSSVCHQIIVAHEEGAATMLPRSRHVFRLTPFRFGGPQQGAARTGAMATASACPGVTRQGKAASARSYLLASCCTTSNAFFT